MKLKLSAPKQITWWIAVALGVIAILNHYNILSLAGSNEFLFLMAGFLLFAIATTNKGL